jgi:hypothetical protein
MVQEFQKLTLVHVHTSRRDVTVSVADNGKGKGG